MESFIGVSGALRPLRSATSTNEQIYGRSFARKINRCPSDFCRNGYGVVPRISNSVMVKYPINTSKTRQSPVSMRLALGNDLAHSVFVLPLLVSVGIWLRNRSNSKHFNESEFSSPIEIYKNETDNSSMKRGENLFENNSTIVEMLSVRHIYDIGGDNLSEDDKKKNKVVDSKVEIGNNTKLNYIKEERDDTTAVDTNISIENMSIKLQNESEYQDTKISTFDKTSSPSQNKIEGGNDNKNILLNQSPYHDSEPLQVINRPIVLSLDFRKNTELRLIRFRYLTLFLLLRCADWCQGPNFYSAYASKNLSSFVSFLPPIQLLYALGFLSSATFGPFMGKIIDNQGCKIGTLLCVALSAIGALSVKSQRTGMLLLGRLCSGISSTLMLSAPETWLVKDFGNKCIDEKDRKYLSNLLCLAYVGDSVIGIFATYFSMSSISKYGPISPFTISLYFLITAAFFTSFCWRESVIKSSRPSYNSNSSIRKAIRIIRRDQKLLILNTVQALFETAMYTFVLLWPVKFAQRINVLRGPSFLYMMISCLVGSSMFGVFNKIGFKPEIILSSLLGVSTLSFILLALSSHISLVASSALILVPSFIFEVCAGMYFPTMGALKAKYIPVSCRGVITNLFNVPLNVLLLSVYFCLNRANSSWALSASAFTLGLASLSVSKLLKLSGSNNPGTKEI